MKKSGKKVALEIVKAMIYLVLGIVLGILFKTDLGREFKIMSMTATACIWALIVVLFASEKGEKEKSVSNVDSRVRAKTASAYQDKTAYGGTGMESSQMQSARMSSRTVQNNPLDRRPMSAEKREQREKNRIPVSKVVLLNEEGRNLMEWNVQRKTSLIIGKSSEKEPVDIDLSGSAVAQMISKQHAVLNYTEKGWYVDDIDSKNGTRVKKATQNAIMDVRLVGAIEVEVGDIIYIANAMLQIQ